MLLHHFIALFCVLCASAAGNPTDTPIQAKILYTFQNTVTATTNSSSVGTCSDSEWRCADGSCIPKEGRCNAAVDCKDASDEYLDTCEGVVRPTFRLQMLCFYFMSRSQRICPQICYDQPAFCYYALMAENGEPNTCRFPKYPQNGKYTIAPLVNRPVSEGFRLNYTCDQSHALVQSQPLECVNGTWVNGDEHRYCAGSCEIPKADNFTYICHTPGKPCSNQVPVDTVVTVMRKEMQDDPVSIDITCQKDRTFTSLNITMDCVTEIDNLQLQFENPTMQKMIQFESKFNQFKPDEASSEFQKLIEEFHEFENTVKETLEMMRRKSVQCDMYLDLILYNLQKTVFKL